MVDLKLSDETHDLVFENGDFKITTSESESLQQRLVIKLLTFRNEWYLNTELGIPYYQRIFQKNTAKETIDAIFKSAILEEDSVLQLRSFQSSIDRVTRVYTLNFEVVSSNSTEVIPVNIEI